jgi:hypothetical protein
MTSHLTAASGMESIGDVSDMNNSKMGFFQTQMSMIDPQQLKVIVISLLLFAMILVCRKIVSLDQALARA